MSQDQRQNNETRRTIVEEGTQFKGDLSSTCPVDVRGRVEGQVEAPSLTVSAAGAVHGKAKVGAVRSEGELSGEFEAETIQLSGSVKDQTVIRARSLEVRLASAKGQQVVFGDCELCIGDEPTEHDVVEEPVEHVPEVAVDPVVARASEVEVGVQPNENVGTNAEASEASEGAVETAGTEANDASTAAAEAGDDTEASDEIEASDIVEEPSETAEAADDDAPATLEEALTTEAEAVEGKGKGKRGRGKRKNENGGETAASGWTTPPSQPPPAH